MKLPSAQPDADTEGPCDQAVLMERLQMAWGSNETCAGKGPAEISLTKESACALDIAWQCLTVLPACPVPRPGFGPPGAVGYRESFPAPWPLRAAMGPLVSRDRGAAMALRGPLCGAELRQSIGCLWKAA